VTAVGSFFSSSPGTVVAANGNVPLTTVGGGNTAGAFSLTSNTVTVVQAGTYLLSYRAAVSAGTPMFQLVVNGTTLVPGTIGVAVLAAAGVRNLTGEAAVTLTANSTVLVRNVSTGTATLAPASSGQTPTSLALTILKVG
jgi:hypothetical protein